MDITITTYTDLYDTDGECIDLSWEDFKKRIYNVKRTSETVEEYWKMSDKERGYAKNGGKDLKVGGFIGGRQKDGKRSLENFICRTLITIDEDDATPDTVENFEFFNPDMTYICYPTHSSTKEKPRLRWVFPLLRPVNSLEYRAIVFKVCDLISPSAPMKDKTTDEWTRFMYWPSCSKDAEYETYENDGEWIDPDKFLEGFDYTKLPSKSKDTVKEYEDDDENIAVPEGNRNGMLFKFCMSLRKFGLGYKQILPQAREFNSNCLNPPLSSGEIDSVVRSACRYDKGTDISIGEAYADFSDLGEYKPKEVEPEKPKKLTFESLASILARDIPEVGYIIPDLIPVGLIPLVAPPKFGKSWMALDLSIAVASGTDFLGFQPKKTGVMYLALEDNAARLKNRANKILKNRGIKNLENLLICQYAPSMDAGLIQQLEDAKKECPFEVGLIIIDTLQKIREKDVKRNINAYAQDYDEMSALHNYALSSNVALMVLHHTNKGDGGNDNMSKISGSNGILGSSDNILMIEKSKRQSDEAKLQIDGRDVTQRTLVVMFNKTTYRWENLGEEKSVEESRADVEYRHDPVANAIRDMLDSAEEMASEDTEMALWKCTASELLDKVEELYGKTEYNARSIGRYLQEIEQKLISVDGIFISTSVVHGKKTYTFSRDIFK